MATKRNPTKELPTGLVVLGLACVVIGVLLFSLHAGYSGFVKGLLQGGGVGAAVVGLATMTSPWWPTFRNATTDGSDGQWLPSRDEPPR